MLKKAIVAGGAAVLLSSLAVGTPIFSYARCGANWLSETANDSVPLEWELKRARQMITDLKPEIERNAKRIAREKIEVARLEKELDLNISTLAKAESDIQRLRDDLAGDADHYTYAGRTYTSVQVREDLKSRFKRFKTRRATSEKLEQMLSARQSSLTSAQAEMEEMLNARRQLEVEVENLQARLGALRVAQTASQIDLDGSQLSKTRNLLDSIATRIDVEEETMTVDAAYFGEIDLDEPADENLLEDIAAYFDGSQTDSKELVAIQLD